MILDVVYNHTAEGNHLGPTLSFRGIDNASYYRLSPEDPRYYMDFTGCGNTFNMRNPRVLQLIMDSLRYWIIHMHVDGFLLEWQKAIGGGGGNSLGYCIKQTVDDGYIVAGEDTGAADNHGLEDAFIAKLSSTGTLEWQKSYGGSGRENVTELCKWQTMVTFFPEGQRLQMTAMF